MQGTACAVDTTNRLAFIGERGMSGVADQDIVERVIAGDTDSFSILVDRYQDRIYSAVLNYVSNPDDAVDVAQEAFVKAYTKLATFNRSSAFYTWIYRIALNAAVDFLRKKKSRPADSLDDARYSQAGVEPVSKDPASDPEKVLVRSDNRRALREAIARLSDKLRSVIVLHDVEGLSQEEVAEILQVPIGTVKSRASRARMELRHLLSKQLGEV